MDYYYLAHQNARGIFKTALGSELISRNFNYNAKHKYWYRLTDGGIIQFVGLYGNSGGHYYINYLCQPIFVPISLPFYEECRGRAPGMSLINVTSYMYAMWKNGTLDVKILPLIQASDSQNNEETIRQHMRISFNVVVRKDIDEIIDVETCLRAHKRQVITLSSLSASEESRKEMLLSADDITVLSLLSMHRYREAENVIIQDRMMVKKHGIESSFYDKYLPYLDDDIKTDNLISEYKSANMKLLAKDGFFSDMM